MSRHILPLPSERIPQRRLTNWIIILLLLTIGSHPHRQQQLFSQFNTTSTRMTTNTGSVFDEDIRCEEEEATATTPPVTNISDTGALHLTSMDVLMILIDSLASSIKDIKGSVASMQTKFQE